MEFSKIIRITKSIFQNKNKIFMYLAALGIYNNMSDEEYIQKMYKARTGCELELERPKTYNEKLQWLKLYDRNPLYTTMVDKYAVKKYVAEIIGEEYIIPTLGVWDNFDDIDFDKLPQQFVLKCTHDSGGVVIVKDKNSFNKSLAKRKIEKLLKKNYFFSCREWPYKNVKPRIIAEAYLVDESGNDLKDYKIFTFNGQPKFIEVHFDRFINHKTNVYTNKWEFVDVITDIKYPNDCNRIIEKPQNLDVMITFASKLSKDIPHVRVDFYNISGKIYFGEMTFYHASGYSKMEPESLNVQMGKWIDLPKREF